MPNPSHPKRYLKFDFELLEMVEMRKRAKHDASALSPSLTGQHTNMQIAPGQQISIRQLLCQLEKFDQDESIEAVMQKPESLPIIRVERQERKVQSRWQSYVKQQAPNFLQRSKAGLIFVRRIVYLGLQSLQLRRRWDHIMWRYYTLFFYDLALFIGNGQQRITAKLLGGLLHILNTSETITDDIDHIKGNVLGWCAIGHRYWKLCDALDDGALFLLPPSADSLWEDENLLSLASFDQAATILSEAGIRHTSRTIDADKLGSNIRSRALEPFRWNLSELQTVPHGEGIEKGGRAEKKGSKRKSSGVARRSPLEKRAGHVSSRSPAGGYWNHKEAEDSLPNPASKRRRKSTEPGPKRRRLQGPSRADVIHCADQPQEDICQPSNSHVLLDEDNAMQALLTAVDHAVSFEHDQQLDGVPGVSGSLEWEGLDSREQVESNSLQQLCVALNTNTSAFENTFMPECQIGDINETVNAGNNQPFFDYANAYDLNTIAFDYNSAYDLNTIAFDYNSAYDLNTIAFDYNNGYDLTTFAASNCTTAYNPSSLSAADTACSLHPLPISQPCQR
ncbi:hypothetical protein DL98DRAFT_577459 [Cadophora sp. DSE1049]|nr:hypothetical protein DL98DRAFT_577459 [Cadophora sp. DSE1049]